eukprot:12736688-Alexandrium_andersonii.AAC.1
MSTFFEPLWRPQLHVVGLLIEGLVGAYIVTDCDMKKNQMPSAHSSPGHLTLQRPGGVEALQ